MQAFERDLITWLRNPKFKRAYNRERAKIAQQMNKELGVGMVTKPNPKPDPKPNPKPDPVP